jgi:SagB-type dehydrogenase family enzyme
LRAPAKKRGRQKRGRQATPAGLSAKLSGHVTLEARATGEITARFHGYSVALGTFGAEAAARAQDLRTGLPLASFAAGRRSTDKEIDLLVRRLARHGLLEYRLRRPRSDDDQVVIEPQMADYWPQMPKLGDADVLVLSRFAYLRRRGSEMVLESPRAGALFKIRDPKVAAAIATLASPQQVKRLRRQDGFPGLELLSLLVDCQILFKPDRIRPDGLRPDEGDDHLVVWDFHDLLFHTRAAEGRHANPSGGVYPYVGVIPPQPAVRPSWPGQKIDLRQHSDGGAAPISPTAKLLRERHSTRTFDETHPITLAELARFLDGAARVQSQWSEPLDPGSNGGPMIEYATRPYPSGGGSWALELYLAVDRCEGLPRGFYHYDAAAHALVPIEVRTHELDAALRAATFAMGVDAAPQLVITIAARFGRMSWKYSSIAYSLILKEVGVLMQTFYLMATDMGLGGCAIGSGNIDLFAKMTGVEFHVEGSVGQFALGRGAEPRPSE